MNIERFENPNQWNLTNLSDILTIIDKIIARDKIRSLFYWLAQCCWNLVRPARKVTVISPINNHLPMSNWMIRWNHFSICIEKSFRSTLEWFRIHLWVMVGSETIHKNSRPSWYLPKKVFFLQLLHIGENKNNVYVITNCVWSIDVFKSSIKGNISLGRKKRVTY